LLSKQADLNPDLLVKPFERRTGLATNGFPHPVMHNTGNLGLSHSVLFGQNMLKDAFLVKGIADIYDVTRIEPGHRVLFPHFCFMSAALRCIALIFNIRAKIKVFRITAQRIVAFVKHVKGHVKFSKDQFVRNAMCSDILSVAAHHSVTMTSTGAEPISAFSTILRFYSTPKPFVKCAFVKIFSAFHGTYYMTITLLTSTKDSLCA